ncbi:methyl-CpG-binding domain-containing protein 7-like protein isoform X2 [Tanacetum coccineum]
MCLYYYIVQYFVDPETGRKFRSRNEVQRYLNNEDKPPKIKPLRLEYNTKDSVDQKMMITSPSTPFTVPNGWIIHMVPRANSPRVDRYFIDPETGKKFRSRNEVQRYLNNEDKPPKIKPLRLEYSTKDSLDQKMMVTSEENMTPRSNWRATKGFTVPDNWYVERVPRKSGKHVDKYYHDPVTGHKFRSVVDVERYLTEGYIPSTARTKRQKYLPNSCESRKKIVSSGKMLDFDENNNYQYQLVNVTPTRFTSTSEFSLPDGWIMEEVPRRESNQVDRYYYEPGTGKKFRSLSSVQRHLAELQEDSPLSAKLQEGSRLSAVLEELRDNNAPISKAFNLASSKKNHASYNSPKKSISRNEGDSSSFSKPPSKINWVIGSSSGEKWHAFADDTLVPDSTKQQWGNRFKFKFSINDAGHYAPMSG